MASIHRRRKSKVWIAFFRDANGVQHGRSTGVTDRKSAQKIADQFEEVSRTNRSLRQITRVISEMYQLAGGKRVELVTVREYIDRWLGAKKNEVAPSSFSSYTTHLSRFAEFLGDRIDRPLLELVKADITSYRDWLARDVSSARANLLLNTTKALLRSAVEDDLLADNVAENVAPVRREDHKREKRAFTLPELQAVMVVSDSEWQSLIRFGLATSQRLMDVATLRWDNVDLATGVLRLTAQKTGKTIILPLSENLRDHISTLSADDSYLHPRAARTAQSTLSHEFALLLVAAGLAKPQAEAKGRRKNVNELSYHSLRHTAVSLLKTAGLPMATVMSFAGHSSEQMSQHYTHVDLASLQKAANALPRI